jgi:hypothetical protein
MEKRKNPQDFAINESALNEKLLKKYTKIFEAESERSKGGWFYPDPEMKLLLWNTGFYRYVQGFLEGRETCSHSKRKGIRYSKLRKKK